MSNHHFLPRLPSGLDVNLVYVADTDLRVVYTNERWATFAEANNGERLLSEDWHASLLDSFSGSEKVRWTAIYQALLSGKLTQHTEQFQCPSPSERRCFVLVIDRILDRDGQVEYLLHYTVQMTPEQVQTTPLDGCYQEEVINRTFRPKRFLSSMHFEPLEATGGDFVWESSCPDHVDVVIGDFVGHGHEAAAHALHAVRWLDATVSPEDSVGQTVARLNEVCYDWAEQLDQMVFATGLYMRCYLNEKRIEICSFGHASPIFSETGELEIEGGLPVGLMRSNRDWPVQEICLNANGCRFLTYSDGISEQFNAAGQMFGSDRLVSLFRESLMQRTDVQRNYIMRAVESFRGDALVKDDRTLMILQFQGAFDDRRARAPRRLRQVGGFNRTRRFVA